jgi:hypothetical protein
MNYRGILLFIAACSLIAQPAASYKYTVKGDEKTVEITNVNYELVGSDNSRMVLRKTTQEKQVIGDIGMHGSSGPI